MPIEPGREQRIVTAIVVTRNRRDDLKRCLDSLAAQRPAVDIIVVDNASEDGTDTLLAADHPGVTVLKAPTNLGTSLTRNAAACLARGDYLWFLDDDAEARDPELAARLVNALVAAPDLAAVGGEAVLDDADHIVGVKRLNMLVNGMVRGELLTDLAAGQLADANCLATCCLCIRREAFAAVGGFDPMFRFYREDMDLSQRLRNTGWRLAVMGRLPVIHHFSAAGRGLRLFSPQIHRNVYLFRHRRWRDLLLLPWHDLGYLLAPASLGRALRFGRNAEHGAHAMIHARKASPLRVDGLLRAVAKGSALALAIFAGYLLCLPRLPAAIRRRGDDQGGLDDTGLSPFSIRQATPHAARPHQAAGKGEASVAPR